MSLNCTWVTLIIYWSASLFDIAINTQQMSCQSLLECTPFHPLQIALEKKLKYNLGKCDTLFMKGQLNYLTLTMEGLQH